MKKWFFLLLLLAGGQVSAQQLYRSVPGASSRVSSFENLNGVKGQGGKDNATGKGHAYEDLKAGVTKTLLEVSSAGIVQRIWVTISDRSPAMLRSLRLRMYWDGRDKPAVDVPFGDFFSAAIRPVAFQSALFSDPEGRSFVCTIPMPFRKGARITLTNEAASDLQLLFFDIDFITQSELPPDDLYFHACWTRTNGAPVGDDAVLLPPVTGRGRFLGVSVGVNTNPAYGKSWFGEGEVKVWLDGDQQYPTINGTGTEDYVGTGWGMGAFIHPFQGCLVADTAPQRYAFYRWHVPDAIYFEKDCRVSMQQIGGWGKNDVLALQANGAKLKPVTIGSADGFHKLLEPGQQDAVKKAAPNDWLNFYRSDDYAATAYFYLDSPADGLPPLAPVADRVRGTRP
jgi:hypothetical protein